MDAVFLLALAVEAIPIGLVTFSDRPSRRRRKEDPGSAGGGHLRGFNGCAECGSPLTTAVDAPWRLAGTCSRCGLVQQWATEGHGAAPAVEPWVPRERTASTPPRPAPRTPPRRSPASAKSGRQLPARPAAPGGAPRVRGLPVRGASPPPAAPGATPSRRVGGGPASPSGVPARDVRSRPAPIPPRVAPRDPVKRPAREPAPLDPFLLRRAVDALEGLGLSRVQRRGTHRPRPERKGFRREKAISRVSAALGQRGFNCCEECADPLPREPDREWRYAGTCPRCGHVQIWAT
jgi:hypothetical protein